MSVVRGRDSENNTFRIYAQTAPVLAHAFPDADDVPRRVAERGDAEVALRVGRVDDLGAAGDRVLERRVDRGDVDVRPDAGGAGHGQLRHEVADDVPGGVLEARIVAVAVHLPAEDGLVEGRRLARVRGGDPKVGDPAVPEDPRLLLGVGRHGGHYGRFRRDGPSGPGPLGPRLSR